jgi:hypothetical protein
MKKFLQLAAVAALAFSPSIYAAVTQELTISDGTGDSFTIDQNGNIVATTGTVSIVAGNITVDGVGAIEVQSDVSGTVKVGGFKINSASAFGLADSIAPQLQDEESLDTSSTGAGTLTITYTDTTYSNLANSLKLSGSESTANTPGSSVIFTALGSNGAALPATTPIGALPSLTGNSDNASNTFANPFTGASASLTSVSTITFKGAGAFNTTFDIASGVPEPSSVVLLGSLLLGVATIVRKRVASRA